MTFRNTNKYKQSLNIQIQESPQKDLLDGQKSQEIRDESLYEGGSVYDDEEDGESSDSDGGSGSLGEENGVREQQYEKDEGQLDSDKDQSQNDNLQKNYLQTANKQSNYTHNHEVYTAKLIQNAHHHQPLSTYNPHQQEKDLEVQKIIQDVLYKRKQKQRQKQLLENIMKSDKKKDQFNGSSIFRYEKEDRRQQQSYKPMKNRQKFLSLWSQQQQNANYGNLLTVNQQKSRNDLELMSKCKDIQTKIKILMKKKAAYEKEQKLKQLKLLDPKQQNRKKSKKELSLEKLQKRLQKALNLNTNLNKRLKLEKSKLSSIISASRFKSIGQTNPKGANKSIKSSVIDQESTIREVQNTSTVVFNNRNHYGSKNKTIGEADTFRSGGTIDGENGRNGDYVFFRQAKSPSTVNFSKGSVDGSCVSKNKKKTQKEPKKYCKNCNKQITSTKNSLTNNHAPTLSSHTTSSQLTFSPTKYKSPVLQFNSYLIDSQKKDNESSSLHKGSTENIYIEDDLAQQVEQNSVEQQRMRGNIQKADHARYQVEQMKKREQLERLMERLRQMCQEEKVLMQRIDQNEGIIKKYEDQRYNQAICL